METLSYCDSAEKVLEKAGKALKYTDIASAAIKDGLLAHMGLSSTPDSVATIKKFLATHPAFAKGFRIKQPRIFVRQDDKWVEFATQSRRRT